jgi:hypothetical protein
VQFIKPRITTHRLKAAIQALPERISSNNPDILVRRDGISELEIGGGEVLVHVDGPKLVVFRVRPTGMAVAAPSH